MSGFIDSFLQNMLSPAVLFFILGAIAGFLKSDLSIPESISRYLALYLMMSIGFKGGVALAQTTSVDIEMILTLVIGVIFGFLFPFLAYALLRWTTKLDAKEAAAIAAHYGSISIVTFATAVAFLRDNNIAYAGYIVAVVALKEVPAILTGLFIAHRAAPETLKDVDRVNHTLSREIFTNGSVLLLLGSFVIGALTGDKGLAKVDAFLIAPFQGLMCLFLLDMGLLVARQMHASQRLSFPLAIFGIYMPLIGAALGLGLAWMIGMDVGTGLLFTILCASASYIAVPAAMRLALPQVSPALYMPLTLAITFPFNVLCGIPLYFFFAKKLLS